MERSSINDHRIAQFGSDPERAVALVCECADPDCWRGILLTRATFDALRAEGKPVLFPGHRPAGRASEADAA
jgi:hypothetical protein